MTYKPTQEEMEEEIKYNLRLVGIDILLGHHDGKYGRKYEEIEKRRAL